jgi:Uma2 family endonuclease
VVPDWVCEVLSPSTESKDREIKMPIYARFGVPYAWLVDPGKRTLETCILRDGAWSETGRFADDDPVRAVPFDAVTIALSDLWAD